MNRRCWSLNTLLFVQTLVKLISKYTWTRFLPPAFPRYHKKLLGSGGGLNIRVDQGSLNRHIFCFGLINSGIYIKTCKLCYQFLATNNSNRKSENCKVEIMLRKLSNANCKLCLSVTIDFITETHDKLFTLVISVDFEHHK